jgi:hypothetical protein
VREGTQRKPVGCVKASSMKAMFFTTEITEVIEKTREIGVFYECDVFHH